MLGQASPSKIKWLIREYNDKDLRNNKTSTKKYLKSIFFINIKRESTCEVFNRAPDRVGKQETRTHKMVKCYRLNPCLTNSNKFIPDDQQ